jgi:hypothetical protein
MPPPCPTPAPTLTLSTPASASNRSVVSAATPASPLSSSRPRPRQQLEARMAVANKKRQVPHQHVRGPCPVVDRLRGVDQFSLIDHPLPSKSCPRPKLVNASTPVVVKRRRQIRHLGCVLNNSSNIGLGPESRAQTASSHSHRCTSRLWAPRPHLNLPKPPQQPSNNLKSYLRKDRLPTLPTPHFPATLHSLR